MPRSAVHRAVTTCQPLESRRLLSDVVLAHSIPFTNTAATFVTLGDLNGDNKLDAISVDGDSGNSVDVMLNSGDNNIFDPVVGYPTGEGPTDVVVGDFNGDHMNDVADTDESGVDVLLNTGSGTLGTATPYADPGATSLAVGDFNGDHNLDIVTANPANDTVSLLLGNGNGTFQPATTFAAGASPQDITVADLNGDGNADIIVANQTANTVTVLLGNGNGTFQKPRTFAVGTSPDGIVVADFNHDGKLDIAALNTESDSISILLGNGDGTFKPQTIIPVGVEPSSIASADFNNDGNPDLLVASYYSQTVSILLGNGDGTFQAPQSFIGNANVIQATAGDINGDGLPDVVTADSFSQTVGFMLNEPILAAAKLHAPASHAVIPISGQTLSWLSVSGAEVYRLLIATNPADLPTDPNAEGPIPSDVMDTLVDSTSTTLSPGVLAGNTKYYWEVQAQGGNQFQQLFGFFSAIRSFTTADTPPTINHISNATVAPSTTFATTGSFVDPDAGDAWTATINYGDGTGTHKLTLHGHKFSLSHLFAKDGNFEVVLKITDSENEAATAKFHVDVS